MQKFQPLLAERFKNLGEVPFLSEALLVDDHTRYSLGPHSDSPKNEGESCRRRLLLYDVNAAAVRVGRSTSQSRSGPAAEAGGEFQLLIRKKKRPEGRGAFS